MITYYEHDHRLEEAQKLLNELKEKQEEARKKYINECNERTLTDMLIYDLALREEMYDSPLTENEKLLLYYIKKQEECHDETKKALEKYENAVKVIKDVMRF